MNTESNPPEPKGKRHFEREAPDGPWTLKCVQWFKPRGGITKVINFLNPDGSLQYQQVNFTKKSGSSFYPRSRFYDTTGRLIFTMETCVIQGDDAHPSPSRVIRYLRDDRTRICELTIAERTFIVRYFDERDQLLSEQEQPHTGEIEFFERDGRNITFESFQTVKDQQGNDLERTSSTRVWKYMTSEDGKPILRMYKQGRFQRDLFVEQIYDHISFPLLFESPRSASLEGK